ncbi:hypothetical protein CWB79_22340, partial [Pseudoalteromonas sp. S1649]
TARPHPEQRNPHPTHPLSNRPQSKTRPGSNQQEKRELQTAISQRDKPNNGFADKKVNVLKHDADKWQQRVEGKCQTLHSDKQQQIKDRAQNIDRQQVQNK